MCKRFENKVAVVTGAGSGIGLATALAFAGEGAAVVVVDISAQKAQAAVDSILEQGGKALAVTADSASMVSEACATGRPVYLFTPAAGAAPKHARLHRRLAELGHLRPLGDGGAPFTTEGRPPLNPATAVADAIRERLSAKAG